MIKKTFLNYTKPYMTVMLQNPSIEVLEQRVLKSIEIGADAFGFQAESVRTEDNNEYNVRKLFESMQDCPVYVTNYRKRFNEGLSDEQLAKGLLDLADYGATLCDIMGDMFCPHPQELTDDKAAIDKQMRLIDDIHRKGAEVLMSSHVLKYTPAERVVEIALEQKRRGADIIKIVTKADSEEEQLENLCITTLLKKELGPTPFLYLSGGECGIHRRMGPSLGCCMYLCVYEHDEFTTSSQPLLSSIKVIREDMFK